jgi:hypothetical protein
MIQDAEFVSQSLAEFCIFKIMIYFIALGSKYCARAGGQKIIWS